MPSDAASLLSELRRAGLLLATGNAGKLAEFRRLLAPLGIQVVSPVDRGVYVEVEETAEDFAGNAGLKARAYAAAAGMPALADDSGLAVDALAGRPGVHSARYGGPGLDDAGRRRKLLEELESVPEAERSARFVCVLALAAGEAHERPEASLPLHLFEGSCEGRILREERGDGGFGYDPVFFDPESGRSFAELSAEEKDARSHRGRAVRAFLDALQSRGRPSSSG